jgi:hypothetical protein
MSRYYRRTTPGLRENLEAGMVAAGLAVGVGALTFYLVRLFLAREPLDPLPPAKGSPTAPEGQEEAGR